jgi:hypothetical protein
MGDAGILTDLTIGGIIDRWEEERAAAVQPAGVATARAA